MKIVEVGPRDGLQNEKTPISLDAKLAFVADLRGAGLHSIEATSFVSPKWVPQLSDADELLASLADKSGLSALVPNVKGLQRANASGIPEIALFTAASDAFTLKNINMTIEESFDAFREVISGYSGRVRGYVSTAFECPFAGRISPAQTAAVIRKVLELGVAEVSIGDTIGTASPKEVNHLVNEIEDIPKGKIAWHFHDTRGTAIANVAAALEHGYTIFDASAAGLGGCPYAPGAGGNLATDDLVYFLEREGIATGIDPLKLAQASLPILEQLGKAPFSKAQQAVLSRCSP